MSAKRMDWWALLPLLVLPFYWSFAQRWAWDDPFITYRYAVNLAAGHGLMYNLGLRVLSTTTPLYALLLSLIHHISANLPVISNDIGILSWVGACCLLVTMIPPSIPGPLRAVGGVFAVLMTNPLMTLGSEIPLYILLILTTFKLFDSGKPGLAGLVSGLATITRPDGVLTGIILLGNLLYRKDRRAIIRGGALFGFVTVPWYAYAWSYFGSPIPVTLAAKQHQAHLAGGYGFIRGLLTTLNFMRKDFGYVEFVIIGLLLCLGIASLVRHREAPLLVQWGLLYIVGYSAIRVVYYCWYYTPLYPVGATLFAMGLDQARLWLSPVFEKRLPAEKARAALAVAMACIALPLLWRGWRVVNVMRQWRTLAYYTLYRSAGEWLGKSTPVDATVGALQIGIIGYYCNRPMIDFAGLIEPDIPRSGGPDYAAWGVWAIQHYHPDYIAMDEPWGAPIEQATWFQQTYDPIRTFHVPGAWSEVIYRRVR